MPSKKWVSSLTTRVLRFEAEQNAARVFGADHLFFVTNGTSTSNKIVWHSQVGPEDVVVVDRNCHKSVLHAIMMTGATPVYLMPTRNHHGIIGPIPFSEFQPETIRRKIAANPLIKGKKRQPRILTLTQSTYDGVMYNTKMLKQTLDGKVDSLHFDEAWLPHATFHPFYKDMHAIDETRTEHSLVFATQSTHKTLAGLSQASQVLVLESLKRKLNRVLFNEAYLMHTSTSPQYSIIASCDVAAAMMDEGRGQELVEEALQESLAFRRELKAQTKLFGVWGPETDDLSAESWTLKSKEAWHGFGEIAEGFNRLDPLKVTILNPGLEMDGSFSARGLPAQIVCKYLREKGAIVEKCGLYSAFIMFTIGITRDRWQRLIAHLVQFEKDFEANRAIEDIMPEFAAAHPLYGKRGVKDVCQEIPRRLPRLQYRAHDNRDVHVADGAGHETVNGVCSHGAREC